MHITIVAIVAFLDGLLTRLKNAPKPDYAPLVAKANELAAYVDTLDGTTTAPLA